jgi:hypothetical protein
MATLNDIEHALQDQDRRLREAYGCLVKRCAEGAIALSACALESLREGCRVRSAAKSHARQANWVPC